MNNWLRHTRFASLVLVLVAALLLGSIVMAQEEKVLVIGHAEATDSLDPVRGFTQTTGVINRVTYQTLVTFPAQDASEILPLLATSWDISDDGLTYTFTLREGVKFSNGDPLTAADVAFSIARLQNVKGNPSFLAGSIASVEAANDTTAVFTLKAPDPAFLVRLANYPFSISNSKLIMANGGTDAADADTTDTAEDFLNSTSAGTGPYMLARWERQVVTELVRNPEYWGEPPYFDRVIITNIPEPATQKVALESGEIDIALDLTADQVRSLEGVPNLAIFKGPGNIVHFLLMNADESLGGPVTNPTVQLAICYALDYEGFVSLWGGVTPGTNLAVGLGSAYPPEKAFKRDVEKAKALLAEAGYPDGFEITLNYPDFSFQGVNMNTNAQKIQADLADVGIKVTLNPGDLQVSLQEYRTGLQGFAYWFWGPDVLDPLDFLSFLPGGKVASERANWTPERASAELNALIERARVESDADEREALFDQLQAIAQQSGVFAPFNQPGVQTAFKANLQGYYWHPQWLLNVALLSRSE